MMKPMGRYREYVALNRNVLAAFAASMAVSAGAAQLLLARHDDHLNTTYTLLVDYAAYFTVFGGLFYRDNRRRYGRGGRDAGSLRKDLAKIAASLGAGEAVYTVARWVLQYYLLVQGHDPYAASLVGQGVSMVIYLAVLNMGVRFTRLFEGGGGGR